MKKVSIIILNWNGKNYISKCLDSVSSLERRDLDLLVIVVDNGSTDGSDRLIETKYKTVKLLRNSNNLGFAGGNNVGIKHALENNTDYVMLLNSDTIVDEDLVVQLIKAADSNDKIGIVGPKIYFVRGFEYHKERYNPSEKGKVFWYAGGVIDWDNIILSHRGVDEVDKGQYDNSQGKTDFVTGCCLFARRKVFEEVGMLNEKYYLYLEDAEFCQRANKAGFKILFTPDAKLWHLNAGSSSIGGGLHDYFITRNRLLFGMQYASFRTKLSLLREAVKLILKGREWQRVGARDFFLGNFGKGAWGTKSDIIK